MLYQFQHFGLSQSITKEYGKNLNFASHLHQSFEFLTVLEGEMEIMVDNKAHYLKKDDCIFIFPNQLHSISSKKSKHMLCIFSPSLVKAYSSMISGKIPVNNKFTPKKFITDGILKMNDETTEIEKKGLFYLLCAEFDKNASYIENKADDKNLLYIIFKFVEENYNKDCSLAFLSKKTGYSYSYLSRFFKKITGISFNSYVNYYRIQNACYLLKNSPFSVLECSLECGYSSLRSFNRNFMEIMSVSPKKFREL